MSNDVITEHETTKTTNETLAKQIKEFQENFQRDIAQRIAEDKELFKNSSFDSHFKSLEERASLYYISLNEKNETFHMSSTYEEFITNKLLKHEPLGLLEKATLGFFTNGD